MTESVVAWWSPGSEKSWWTMDWDRSDDAVSVQSILHHEPTRQRCACMFMQKNAGYRPDDRRII